jgi:sporulation protein YlmC with PRC-barrel domain
MHDIGSRRGASLRRDAAATQVAVGQSRQQGETQMRRSVLVGSAAICFCFGMPASLFAAQPPAAAAADDATPAAKPAGEPPAAATAVTVVQPAEACLSDVRSFSRTMQKDGYWLGGSDYDYGYPMGAYGYGYGYPMGLYPASMGYSSTRPGYEVRTLIASANILARLGQQQPCEDILATTRTIYQTYVTQMRDRGVTMADGPNWRRQQIAAAQPVIGQTAVFRSDELLSTTVLSPHDESLGTVHDIVMSPETGKIAYLVIGRGGLFGIDEKFVPVPWDHFKATPGVSVLVLNATKAVLQAAPQVSDDKFGAKGQFEQESQKVDAYWKLQLASKDSN